jgi:anti-sigma B factor antagonist
MNQRWEQSPDGAPIDFWIDVEPQRDTVRLIPAGELDIATVGQLQSELDDLIEAGLGQIVIDLRGVEFIDSTGLHLLVEAHERANHEAWQLAIVPGRHDVQQLFEITGTIEQLPFTPNANGADPRDAQHRMTSSSPPGRRASLLPVRLCTPTYGHGDDDLAGPTSALSNDTHSRPDETNPPLPNTPRDETPTGPP